MKTKILRGWAIKGYGPIQHDDGDYLTLDFAVGRDRICFGTPDERLLFTEQSAREAIEKMRKEKRTTDRWNAWDSFALVKVYKKFGR